MHCICMGRIKHRNLIMYHASPNLLSKSKRAWREILHLLSRKNNFFFGVISLAAPSNSNNITYYVIIK